MRSCCVHAREYACVFVSLCFVLMEVRLACLCLCMGPVRRGAGGDAAARSAVARLEPSAGAALPPREGHDTKPGGDSGDWCATARLAAPLRTRSPSRVVNGAPRLRAGAGVTFTVVFSSHATPVYVVVHALAGARVWGS